MIPDCYVRVAGRMHHYIRDPIHLKGFLNYSCFIRNDLSFLSGSCHNDVIVAFIFHSYLSLRKNISGVQGVENTLCIVLLSRKYREWIGFMKLIYANISSYRPLVPLYALHRV